MSMEPEDYIRKCRIQLNREHPFFSHIVNRLNLVETEEKPTMAVDHRGNMFYNEDFVEEVVENDSLEALKAVIIHEGLHVALHGHQRLGSRDPQTWNVAQDLIINHMVVNEEGYEFPSKIELVPEKDGDMVIEQLDLVIEDVSNESFESIYEKIAKEIDEQQDGGGEGEGEGEQEGQGKGSDESSQGDQSQNKPSSFDDPVYSDENKEQEIPSDVDEDDLMGKDKSMEETEKEWDKIVDGAENKARRQGNISGSLYEKIKNSGNEKRDYSKYLRKMVKENMPDNYTYMKPHKKSRSMGAYFPSTDKGEKVEVVVTIDTSGSMTSEDLQKALNEIKSIISSFEDVDLTVVQHDTKVSHIEEYNSASKNDFEELEIKGRGGTSHVDVFEKIEELKEERQQNFVVVSITDGYTTVPEQSPVDEGNILWVINNYNIGMETLNYGTIIRNAEN